MIRCRPAVAVVLLWAQCAAVQLSDVVQDISESGVGFGAQVLQEMEGVALDLQGVEAEKGTCGQGESVPATLCTGQVDSIKTRAHEAQAERISKSIHDSVFGPASREVSKLLVEDTLNSIDLDIDEPVIDTDFCIFHRNAQTNTTKAACVESCRKTKIQESYEKIQLERLSRAFTNPFSLATKTVFDIKTAFKNAIISEDADDDVTKKYLHEKILEDSKIYWIYAVDVPRKKFVGFKRVVGRSDLLYTEGTQHSMKFFTVPRHELVEEDTTWSMESTVWYNTLEESSLQSTWTPLYTFSPPQAHQVGVSYLSHSQKGLVIGIDFYLNGISHTYVDQFENNQHGKNPVFVLNSRGQVVASNQLSVVKDGHPLEYQDIGIATLREVAERAILTFPSILNPEEQVLERSELERGRAFAMEYDGTTHHVEVKAVEELIDDDLTGLKWTVVHVVAQSDDFLPRTKRDTFSHKPCPTVASCNAMRGGDILLWRSSQARFIEESMAFTIHAVERCLRSIALDLPSLSRDLPFEYLLDKLAVYSTVSHIHFYDTKAKRLHGVEREPTGRIVFNEVRPNESSGVAYLREGEIHITVREFAAPDSGVYEGLLPGAFMLNPVVYSFAEVPSVSLLYRDANSDYVVNVGVDATVLSAHLQGENPLGTVSFLADSSANFVAAHPKGVADSAVVVAARKEIANKVKFINDASLRRAELFVTTDKNETYDMDYKMLTFSGGHQQQRHSPRFLILATVRSRHQRAKNNLHGLAVLRDNTTCDTCIDADIAVESRVQTLRGMTDEANAILSLPPRVLLAFESYLEAGALSDNVTEYAAHAYNEIRAEPALAWCGVFVRTEDDGFDFHGATPYTEEATNAELHDNTHVREILHLAAGMLAHHSVVEQEHLWSWTEATEIFRHEVLTAVRPKAKDGVLEYIFVAGVSLTTLQRHVMRETRGKSFVVDHAGEVLFTSEKLDAFEAREAAKRFLAVNPSYTKLAAAPWMVKRPKVAHASGEDHKTTISGLAYRHTSPAWRSWKAGTSATPSWVQWLFLTIDDRAEVTCLETLECREHLRARSEKLSSQLWWNVMDSIGEAYEIVHAAATHEFTPRYEDAVRSWSESELFGLRRYMVAQLSLYSQIDGLSIGVDQSSHFIAVFRKSNVYTDFTVRESFAADYQNFAMLECRGRTCRIYAVTSKGTRGVPTTVDFAPFNAKDGVDKNGFESYMKRRSELFISRVDRSTGLNVTSYGYSQHTLTHLLRSFQVPIETNIIVATVTDGRVPTIIAANRDQASKLFIQAGNALGRWLRNKHISLVSNDLGKHNFTYMGAHFHMYLGFTKGLLVGVFKKTNTDPTVITSFDVGFAHDDICAEQGFCEAEVARLKELTYSTKAHFIEQRSRNFLKSIEDSALSVAFDGDVTVFPSSYDEHNPIITEIIALMEQKRNVLSAIRFTSGDNSLLTLPSREIIFHNSSGVYYRSATGNFTTPSSAVKQMGQGFTIPTHLGKETQWEIHDSSIAAFKKTHAGVLTLLADEATLKSNCLGPFSGVVLKTDGTHVVTNTVCDVAPLEDTVLLHALLHDTAVASLNECSLDLRLIQWGPLSFVVGSMEKDLHENSYPAVAPTYACVTWASCRVKVDQAEMGLLDTTLTHVSQEVKVGMQELLSVSEDVPIRAQILSAKHMTFIADLTHQLSGYFAFKTFEANGEILSTEIYQTRCIENMTAAHPCKHIGVYRPGGSVVLKIAVRVVEGDAVFVVSDGFILRRSGNLLSGVQISFFTAGVPQEICHIAFRDLGDETNAKFRQQNQLYRDAKLGVIQHEAGGAERFQLHVATDSQQSYIKVSANIVITASHVSSYIPVSGVQNCAVDCEKDVEKFQGIHLALTSAKLALDAVVTQYKQKLELLYQQIVENNYVIDNDRDVPSPDPTFLCEADEQPYTDSEVGWYDGKHILSCRRHHHRFGRSFIAGHTGEDGFVVTRRQTHNGKTWVPDEEYSPESPVHWLKADNDGGYVYITRPLPKGGHLAMKLSPEVFHSISPSSKFGIALKNHGKTYWATTDRAKNYKRQEEITVAIPAVGHNSWSLNLYSHNWVQWEPPRDVGCFTVAQCQCKKEEQQAPYGALLTAIHTQLHTFAVGAKRAWFVRKQLSWPVVSLMSPEQIIKRVEILDLKHFIYTNNTNHSYAGVLRHNGRHVFFTCGDEGCEGEDGVGALLPRFSVLHKRLQLSPEDVFTPSNRVQSNIGITGEYGVCMKVSGGAPAVKDLLDVGTAPDYIQFDFGMDLIDAGMTELVQQAPVGGEMFVVNSDTSDVIKFSSSDALSADTQTQITQRCARKLLYEQSHIRSSCGYKGQAFSLVSTPLAGVDFIGLIPRRSKSPLAMSIQDESNIKRLFPALSTSLRRIQGACHSLGVYSLETGNKAEVSHSARFQTAVTTDPVMQELLRERSREGWDVFVRDSLNGTGFGFEVFFRVKRNGVPRFYVSASFESGRVLDGLVHRALLALGTTAGPVSVALVDSSGDIVSDGTTVSSRYQAHRKRTRSPDVALYSPSKVRVHPRYNKTLTATALPFLFAERNADHNMVSNVNKIPFNLFVFSAYTQAIETEDIIVSAGADVNGTATKESSCVRTTNCEGVLKEALRKSVVNMFELTATNLEYIFAALESANLDIKHIPTRLAPMLMHQHNTIKLLERFLFKSTASYAFFETNHNWRVGVYRERSVHNPSEFAVYHISCADVEAADPTKCKQLEVVNASSTGASDTRVYSANDGTLFKKLYSALPLAGKSFEESMYFDHYGVFDGFSNTRVILHHSEYEVFATIGVTVDELQHQLTEREFARTATPIQFTLYQGEVPVFTRGGAVNTTANTVSVGWPLFHGAFKAEATAVVPSLPNIAVKQAGSVLTSLIPQITRMFERNERISSIEITTPDKETFALYRKAPHAPIISISGTPEIGLDIDRGDGAPIETVTGENIGEAAGCFFEGFGEKRAHAFLDDDFVAYGAKLPALDGSETVLLDICVGKRTNALSSELSEFSRTRDRLASKNCAAIFSKRNTVHHLHATSCSDTSTTLGVPGDSIFGTIQGRFAATQTTTTSARLAGDIRTEMIDHGRIFVSYIKGYTPLYVLMAGNVEDVAGDYGELLVFSSETRAKNLKMHIERSLEFARSFELYDTASLELRRATDTTIPIASFAASGLYSGAYGALLAHPSFHYVGARRSDGILFGFFRKTLIGAGGPENRILFFGCALDVAVTACTDPKVHSVEAGVLVGFPEKGDTLGEGFAPKVVDALRFAEGAVRGLHVDTHTDLPGFHLEIGLSPTDPNIRTNRPRHGAVSLILKVSDAFENSVASISDISLFDNIKDETKAKLVGLHRDAFKYDSGTFPVDSFYASYAKIQDVDHLYAVELTPLGANTVVKFYLNMHLSEFNPLTDDFIAHIREIAGDNMPKETTMTATAGVLGEGGIEVVLHLATASAVPGRLDALMSQLSQAHLGERWRQFFPTHGITTPTPTHRVLPALDDPQAGGVTKMIGIFVALALAGLLLYVFYAKCIKDRSLKYDSVAARGVPQQGYSEVCLRVGKGVILGETLCGK